MSSSPYEIMAEADEKYHAKHGVLPKQHPSSEKKKSLGFSKIEIEKSLSDIMQSLAANQNCSKEDLFQCCANAFEIAEKTLRKLQES